MSNVISIPDKRSTEPEDYEQNYRLGRLKNSWHKGAERQTDGAETILVEEGLTWGSIGQILGYLFGEVDDSGEVNTAFQEKLYHLMVQKYAQTDRGKPLQDTEI